MPERPRKTSIYFGEFRLEVVASAHRTERELFRGDSVHPEKGIQPQSLAVLECILRNAPHVIERDAIIREFWDDKPDESGNLNSHMTAIRKVLGDDHANPQIIRTVRGKGFELIVPAKIKSDEARDRGSSQHAAFSTEDAQAFEEFFGHGAAEQETTSPYGAIVVQADHLEKLTGALEIDVNAGIKSRPGNRSYKARTWVNYNDLLGAQDIVKLFDAHRLRTPQIILSLKNLPEDPKVSAEAAFVVAMGLGFTDRSTRAFKLCHPWMRVSRTSPAGDAVAIHEKLLLRYCSLKTAGDNGFIKAPDEPGFWLRLPRDWNDTYLDSWLALLEIDNTVDPVQDYAIILRYTRFIGGHKQILFVLAGFTERGTAIAGRYVALYWHRLWKTYVQNHPHNGDFVVLIEGPSDTSQARWWREDRNFTITPQVIHDLGITGEGWFERVDEVTAIRKP